MPVVKHRVEIRNVILGLAAVGAVASAFKCIWFFFFFSRNMGGGQLQALIFYLPLVLVPYVLIAVAAELSVSSNLSKVILVTVIFLLLSSSLYYADGLPKVQDGEFGFVFLLAVPQLLLALAVLLPALWFRWGKQASNSNSSRPPPAAAE